MSLRLRLAIAFAAVAIATAAAVAIATPTIVGRGFARLAADGTGGGGAGRGPGPLAGVHAEEVQRETTLTIIAVALAAAAGASVLGLLLARRVVGPLRRLEDAAAAVAGGDLARRSGLADRADELGSLGRSFDSMATSLERVESARRRFFQDAVHELKTPLTVIDATATAVLDGVYAHEDRHLETMREQSRLLARIVDELRTVSLAEEGALPLHLEDVAIDDLVTRTASGHQARADLAGVRLVIRATSGLFVRADRDRVTQIVAALLDNALRHAPSGGEVCVSTVGDRGSVRLDVDDSGPGVAPDDLAHVFDRFYSGDDGHRIGDRAAGSSGLGLAIVAALAEAHGGSVGAGRAPSGGARFWVRLPAHEAT